MRLHATLLLVAFMIIAIPACSGGTEKTPVAPTYPSGKPTGLTVKAGSQSATVNWNAVSGAAGYFVYMSTDGANFKKVQGQMITTLSFQVLDLVNGKIYYFGVSAVGTGGWESAIAYPGGSPTSLPVKPAPPGGQNPEVGVPPDAPANLQGIAKDGAAELKWDSNTENDFSHYRIHQRHLSSGAFGVIVDNFTGLSYRTTDLINGTIYSYYITAVDTEGLESSPSNIVTLTPENFPPEPLNNAQLFVNPGRIVLEWAIPQETDIAKFAIARVEGVDPSTGAEIIGRFTILKPTHTSVDPEKYAGGLIQAWIDVANNRFEVVDMAVTVGVVYTYRLSAIDSIGQEGAPVQLVAPVAVF